MAEVYWDLEWALQQQEFNYAYDKRLYDRLRDRHARPINQELAKFYDRLLGVLRRPAVCQGEWQLLECVPAWEGNWTWDCFLAFAWHVPGEDRVLVTVNYTGNQSQCYVRLPFTDLWKARWRLTDLMGAASYDRHGDDLQSRGLDLDVPPWQPPFSPSEGLPRNEERETPERIRREGRRQG